MAKGQIFFCSKTVVVNYTYTIPISTMRGGWLYSDFGIRYKQFPVSFSL